MPSFLYKWNIADEKNNHEQVVLLTQAKKATTDVKKYESALL